MIDIILALLAMGLNAAEEGSVSTGSASVAVPAAPAPETSTLVAEPQVPTGRFTTAVEVKPILAATRAAWISKREFNGQDLIYVTHLWSWRCGLVEMRVGLNGAPPEIWPLPMCHENEQTPNAIKEQDGLPFREFPVGSIERVEVMITFDDLTTDHAVYDGNGLLQP